MRAVTDLFALLRGRRVGNWILEGLLGQGADATVWQARNAASSQRGALKILDPEAAANPRRREQFEGELALGRRVRGEQLVACIDDGETGGRPWAVFELVEGTSLAEVLKRRGPLDPIWALHVIRELARGLAVLHGLGQVHGDVKPANVLLDGRGRVRLVDYGSAQALSSRGDGRGTPAYQAPEQLRCDELHPSTDLYALGLMLHEMITGERLLRPATGPALYSQHHELARRLPRPSRRQGQGDDPVDEILRGLLVFRPDHRAYRKALALSESIDMALQRSGWDCLGRRTSTRGGRDGTVAYFRAVTCALEGRWVEALRGLRCLRRLPKAEAEQLRKHLEKLVGAQLRSMIASGFDLEELACWIDVAELGGLEHMALYGREARLRLFEEEGEPESLRRLESLILEGKGRWTEIRSALELARRFGRSGLEQSLRALVVSEAAERGWDEELRELGGLRLLPSDLQERVPMDRALGRLFQAETKEALAGGDLPRVCQLCREYLAVHPSSLEAWLTMAHVQERRGLGDEAARAWLAVARIALERGRLHQARGATLRARCFGAAEDETAMLQALLASCRSRAVHLRRDRDGAACSVHAPIVTESRPRISALAAVV